MLLPSGVVQPFCSSHAFLQMIAPMPRGRVFVHRLGDRLLHDDDAGVLVDDLHLLKRLVLLAIGRLQLGG